VQTLQNCYPKHVREVELCEVCKCRTYRVRQDNFLFLYEYTHIKKEVSLPHPVFGADTCIFWDITVNDLRGIM
jgi:hypothetical protein